MKIQVLGSGCPTCKKLHELTSKAVLELGLMDTVEYITGEKGASRIIEMGIMSSPVLVIDEKPAMIGSTSDIEKIKSLIQKYK